MARCTFCSAELPPSPPGASVRCASCGNLTSTPAIPPTIAGGAFFDPAPPPAGALPFSTVDGKKQGASPPPAVVMPSRAGGVDELVGGGLTILGFSALKIALLVSFGIFASCFFGLLLAALRL